MTRVRGLAPYAPKPKAALIVEQVREVLDEYAEFLPLTVRQVFYRLVGAYDWAAAAARCPTHRRCEHG